MGWTTNLYVPRATTLGRQCAIHWMLENLIPYWAQKVLFVEEVLSSISHSFTLDFFFGSSYWNFYKNGLLIMRTFFQSFQLSVPRPGVSQQTMSSMIDGNIRPRVERQIAPTREMKGPRSGISAATVTEKCRSTRCQWGFSQILFCIASIIMLKNRPKLWSNDYLFLITVREKEIGM